MSLEITHSSRACVNTYKYYIVTIYIYIRQSSTVCEIFSIKECRDLENLVRGYSRSLKMALFDRPYTTFYLSAIVSIALSCCLVPSSYLTLNNILTLKFRFTVTQGH